MHDFMIFKHVNDHIKKLEKKQRILNLFKSSIEIVESKYTISPLQKNFAVVEVAYAYQYFGIVLFAKTSMIFIAKMLNDFCDISEDLTIFWLQITYDIIAKDTSFSQKEEYITEYKLENLFAYELMKRIFCCEKNEDPIVGMNIFDHEFVEKIRKVSRKKISNINLKQEFTADDSYLREYDFFLDDYSRIKEQFFNFLNLLHLEPLSLFTWRLEVFVSASVDKIEDSFFIFRENSNLLKDDSNKILALISLLVPHEHKNGHLLLSDTPAPFPELVHYFSNEYKSDEFQLNVFKNWLNHKDHGTLSNKIESLLETGLQYGLFYKIPFSKKTFSYGLTENGSRIVRPFKNLLTDAIIK